MYVLHNVCSYGKIISSGLATGSPLIGYFPIKEHQVMFYFQYSRRAIKSEDILPFLAPIVIKKKPFLPISSATKV